MAQLIKLKRSAVSGSVPLVSQLELGEVAINTFDGKMYIKKNDGVENVIEVGGFTSGPTSPPAPQSGEVWYDTSTSTLKYYDGTNWVPLGGDDLQSSVTTSPTEPTTRPDGSTSLEAGDVYYNTTDDILYAYDGSVWIPVGCNVPIDSDLFVAAYNSAIANGAINTIATAIDSDAFITSYNSAIANGGIEPPSGGITYIRKTANYTAASGEGVIADTTGGSWTLTLPASPAVGDAVVVADGGDWGTNMLTIGRNGSTIEGDAADMIMDLGGTAVTFVYDGTTWQIYAQVGIASVLDSDSFVTAYNSAAAAGGIESVTDVIGGSGLSSTVAGGAITLNVDADQRSVITQIGLDTNDYYVISGVDHNWFIDNVNIMRLETNGTLHADGDIVAFSTTISDPRLKTDIVKIENALDKITALNGYTFTYANNDKKSAGVLANEVEEVLPTAVKEMELPLVTDDGQTYKTVHYDQLHGLVIEAIKEIKADLDAIKEKVGL